MAEHDEQAKHYETVARAIEFIREHALRQPSLEEIARHAGMSEFHFQRVFAQWAGVSPKRFLQYLTKEHAKLALRSSSDVLDAALAAGLSAPSRLHDLIVSCEAMTPGEYKVGAAGVAIEYGMAGTPFGRAVIGSTARGVCYFEFCGDAHEEPIAALEHHWPGAQLHRNDDAAQALAQKIFPVTPAPGRLHVVLKGTNFQLKVWEALLRIEPGRIVSYSQLAKSIGKPGAARAVGSALAANIVAYLIPCHRVIKDSGELSSYRWGTTRKSALLAWEASKEALDTAEIAG
jgi:AraC family transcriptional regulator of adaptative response/methylated-DNA-[protein]-cysteine methyltransferase